MKNKTKILKKMEIIELIEEAIASIEEIKATKENIDNIISINKNLNLASHHIFMNLKDEPKR